MNTSVNAEDIIYPGIDNIKILKFLEKIKDNKLNNTMSTFTKLDEITSFLKEQWAGLFKEYLLNQSKLKETRLINDINNTSKILDKLVTHLTQKTENSDETVKALVNMNHPAIRKIIEITGCKFPFHFTNHTEMTNFLKLYDYAYALTEKDYHVYRQHLDYNSGIEIAISTLLFDKDNKLYNMNDTDWNDNLIKTDSFDDFDYIFTEHIEDSDEEELLF